MLLEKFGDEGDGLTLYCSDSLNLLYPESVLRFLVKFVFFPFLLSFFDEILLFPSKYNKKCTVSDNTFDHTSWKSHDSNKI